MNVLSIFASPHKKGNSSKLHGFFLNPLNQKEIRLKKVFLSNLKINPCLDCGFCQKSLTCSQEDEVESLHKEILKADLISISSPLYFSSLPGTLKNLIDRSQIIWEQKKQNKFIKKKIGFFISSAGGEYQDMFLASKIIVRHFFKTINCSFQEKDYILVSKLDNNKISEEIKSLAKKRGEQYYSRLIGNYCR